MAFVSDSSSSVGLRRSRVGAADSWPLGTSSLDSLATPGSRSPGLQAPAPQPGNPVPPTPIQKIAPFALPSRTDGSNTAAGHSGADQLTPCALPGALPAFAGPGRLVRSSDRCGAVVGGADDPAVTPD
jgi:hypothetical protein